MHLDMLATRQHYHDHLRPVWAALPIEARGAFAIDLPADLALHNVSTNPVLVAGFSDLVAAEKLGYKHIALMEHGIGQSYGGRDSSARHPAYAGGERRENVSLFLHPGPHPAARDRAAYPNARVEVVGSPYLDTVPKRVPGGPYTVAVSFHFPDTTAPESGTAFWDFRDQLPKLAREFNVIGHGHPRFIETLRPLYENMGIEVVDSFEEVCRRADLYIADNTSTLYYFAATGRPVLVLNSSKWSITVDHGLRFWDAAAIGYDVWPSESIALMLGQQGIAPFPPKLREEALDKVFGYRKGAAERAAGVLLDWMEGL